MNIQNWLHLKMVFWVKSWNTVFLYFVCISQDPYRLRTLNNLIITHPTTATIIIFNVCNGPTKPIIQEYLDCECRDGLTTCELIWSGYQCTTIRIDLHSRTRQIHQIVVEYFAYLVINNRQQTSLCGSTLGGQLLPFENVIKKKRLPSKRHEVTSPERLVKHE
jgi:hypothetical protein